MHLFVALTLVAKFIDTSFGDNCPFEYAPAKVCYIALKWHEIAEIRRDIWKEAPDKALYLDGYHYVHTKDEAVKMCGEIAKIEHKDNDFKYWKKDWNKIPGRDVGFRLPLPKTKDHLKWLTDTVLYNAYIPDKLKVYRNYSRMFLGITKGTAPDLVNEMAPKLKGRFYDAGDCGYLYRSEDLPYNDKEPHKEQHGLHWVDCEKKLRVDIKTSPMEVGCEFDTPKDCVESIGKGCAVGNGDKCLEIDGTISQKPHRLGKKCTINETTGNDCPKDQVAKHCKRDCQWGEWRLMPPPKNKCKCSSGKTGAWEAERKRVKMQKAIFGGAECDGNDKQDAYCKCHEGKGKKPDTASKTNLASKFLIALSMSAILCVKKDY